MSRKLNVRKTVGLAVSLVLASAAIFVSTASARGLGPRDPVCDQRVINACATNWQALGYASQQNCALGQPCIECPPNYGYLCGIYSYPGSYAAEPDADTPE
ncbi:MAG: hypothetical protein QOG72_2701 [Sphingomonadales bacterium]|nr:hypothetical protein [Sphingomonadales bacterium]